MFAPVQTKPRVPSFRQNTTQDPFGINVGSNSPFMPNTNQQGLQNTAQTSFGNDGGQFGNTANQNPNATPPAIASLGVKPFNITNTPLYQATQAATMKQLDEKQPLAGFDAQANIARDAQSVAQMQAAKAKRDQLIGQGLKDSGQYISEGIIGPADQQSRDRAELERSLAGTREQMLQQRTQQGVQNAMQLTNQDLQQQSQNYQLLALGTQMQEADKNRVFQSQMQQMQNAFAAKNMNFQALMQQLENMPEDQAADVFNQVAIDAGITHAVIDPATGQPMKNPDGTIKTAPGLQNYKSLQASRALPILQSLSSGGKLNEANAKILSDNFDGLMTIGDSKVISSPYPNDPWNYGTNRTWADSNLGKFMKGPDGRIYSVAGAMPHVKGKDNSGGIVARDVLTDRLVKFAKNGIVTPETDSDKNAWDVFKSSLLGPAGAIYEHYKNGEF